MPQAKILIVEDEAIAAENIAGRLRQQGYDVVGIVDSGAEAIKEASNVKPDLILMDIMLKGEIDGVAAAVEISRQSPTAVVFMTAFGDESTLQRAKVAEPFGYLIKPFKSHELRATIEIALRKQEADLRLQAALEKEAQLRHQVESLNNLKSEFVSVLSHEFRTPLSSIYLSTDLLESQGYKLSDEKKSKRYAHIRRAIARMTKLLDDITSISKSELGKLEPKPTSFQLGKFCADLIDEFRQEYSSYEIGFLDRSNNRNAYLDEKLLYQILHNLLSNAIKYSPVGGAVNLHLTCMPLEDASQLAGQNLPFSTDAAVFSVQDWGIGIPSHAQTRIFDAFFRAENVDTIPGDGLGLAIVKNYADILGGVVLVESELGVGSTFTVVLPLGSS
ncbi:response regulator [Pseudanabaena sp. PCC 6802]|uniref:hybrid sensor histidine kinase/response regulator n=1 Tax=Pseudanabaena sp. PCC 6802 TaxID=118173 RepID=UPI0003498B11|nr:response regulator [Pseudanabaena sp. PCC 6802]